METCKFEFYSQPAGWRAREELFSSKGHLLEEFHLLLKRSVFLLLRPLTDWVRPTTFWRVLLYSKFTDVMLISSKKIPSQKHVEYRLTKYVSAVT